MKNFTSSIKMVLKNSRKRWVSNIFLKIWEMSKYISNGIFWMLKANSKSSMIIKMWYSSRTSKSSNKICWIWIKQNKSNSITIATCKSPWTKVCQLYDPPLNRANQNKFHLNLREILWIIWTHLIRTTRLSIWRISFRRLPKN